VRALVHARDESGGQEAGYGLETEAAQLPGEFIELAGNAQAALAGLRQPLVRLGARLEAIMVEPPDWLDGAGRARIEGARHSLAWRIDLIAAWEALLQRLGGPADPEFVDWLAVDRSDAREFDVGLHRRWLDPMKPREGRRGRLGRGGGADGGGARRGRAAPVRGGEPVRLCGTG
jgi:ATP-dependent DNA helicase DinG